MSNLTIPKGALDFFSKLKENNNRDWFNENKKRFKENVEKPFVNFIEFNLLLQFL